MKERPILFSAPMVRAILAGTKTQTRRIVKADMGRETNLVEWNTAHSAFVPWKWHTGSSPAGGARTGQPFACPYGNAGDRLWVKETHASERQEQSGTGAVRWVVKGDDGYAKRCGAIYAADGVEKPKTMRWRPSIHMPRCLSRIALDVTAVRVERLHTIDELGALAEGVEGRSVESTLDGKRGEYIVGSARDAFVELWRAINGAESWKANPWVWVVEFKRVEAQERAA